MVIWSYLVFYGRLPSRVSQSVYMAEFVILLAIALKNQLWTVRQRRCHVFWIISMVILTFVCLRFGFPKARAVAWEASSRLHFSQSFVEIKDYFKEYPDNFYYLDMNSFGSFTEDALQSSVKECDNFLYMGSWIPNSPWYDTKYKKKGISDPAVALYENPNLYVVFMNTEGISYDYLIAFYAENYPGVRFDIADTVDVSNGLQFLILKGSAETK